MRIFLTGDRSMDPATSVLAAIAVIQDVQMRAFDAGETIIEVATGDLPGFEAAVRYLLPGSVRIFDAPLLDSGKPDLDARHRAAAVDYDNALVFHTAPMESSIYRSAIGFWSDDALEVLP